MPDQSSSVIVVIFAHNEEGRIGACLRSVLSEPGGFPVHVVVNGTTDRTAEVAAGIGPRVHVHVYAQPGKSRSWNRFVLDELDPYPECVVFIDGDAEIAPGSIAALQRALLEAPEAYAAGALPLNGRGVRAYQDLVIVDRCFFGDLYALSRRFLEKMKASGVRLPNDLFSDDGVLASLVKTDLQSDENWRDDRVVACRDAGFFCDPVRLTGVATWRMQHRRMINYSLRYFQNQIVIEIMRRGGGAEALPRDLVTLYPRHLPSFRPRRRPDLWWFDQLALRGMRRRCAASLAPPRASRPAA